jgi:hypothetical protein
VWWLYGRRRTCRLLGASGTGRSILPIGLALAACGQGRRVRYVTTAQPENELVEAAENESCQGLSAAMGTLVPTHRPTEQTRTPSQPGSQSVQTLASAGANTGDYTEMPASCRQEISAVFAVGVHTAVEATWAVYQASICAEHEPRQHHYRRHSAEKSKLA